MKKPLVKKKCDNNGFSLIEVLMAVVILGLIAAPVIQMFYSSYALNLRSKKYLAAADLAQSKIEEYSSMTYLPSKAKMKGITGSIKSICDETGTVVVGTEENTFFSGYPLQIKTSFDDSKKTMGTYYPVKVTVEVYDLDPKSPGVKLAEVSTEIANKR